MYINNPDILSIDNSGIILKYKYGKVRIDFNECASNYAGIKASGLTKCVATPDVTRLRFVFFSTPQCIVAFTRFSFRNFLFGKSGIKKFLELQRMINQWGYTTYDLS